MDVLERVIAERSDDLIQVLIVDGGLSRRQSESFLREAGPALLASYRWQAEELRREGLTAPSTVRNLLAGISGRALAERVGLSPARTWKGLRALVPAVVRAGTSGASPRGDGDRRSGRVRSEDMPRFDIGFGLTLQLGGSGASSHRPAHEVMPGTISHPLFDLLSIPRRGPVSP